MLQLLPI